MSIFRDRTDKFFFVLMVLITLAVGAWFARKWWQGQQQEWQGREVPPPLAEPVPPGAVTGYAPPDSVVVHFVRYGDIRYERVSARVVPEPFADEAAVEVFGYEPQRRPWLSHREMLTGRSPHIEVVRHEFYDDTAAAAEMTRRWPGFAVDLEDPRGITFLRREQPDPQSPNDVAYVRCGRSVWMFNAVDDAVGLRAVAAAGFIYGDTPAH